MSTPEDFTQPPVTNATSPLEATPKVATAPAPEVVPAPAPKVKSSLAGGTWVALIAGALLLILLLLFILQNQQPVQIKLAVWSFSFPAGVGFLLCSIAGALLMAMVGAIRIFELRRQVKKAGRARR